MSLEKINEDFLLLLVNNNEIIETKIVTITNHFEDEKNKLIKLCSEENDNIDEIILFIDNNLKSKLPKKKFNYCKKLDNAFQSVIIDIDKRIKEILAKKKLLYTQEKIANRKGKEYNLSEKISSLKNRLFDELTLWFNIFNIELAYQIAKETPNMLVYSHRISGWSKPQYKITKNLTQEIKTNFGYGNSSYFSSLLTFKGIQITSFSEWIDYRYADFSEVIRYTKNFKKAIPRLDKFGNIIYFQILIENSSWFDAIEFTKDAANLSITDENKFIEKYIISECELLVTGLENIYNESSFNFINENNDRYRVDINGFELIDFKTEKIIGALDFISKIIEYNQIIPTDHYIDRLIKLNERFISNVYLSLEKETKELEKVNADFIEFIQESKKLIEKNGYYKALKTYLKNDFYEQHETDYSNFIKKYEESLIKEQQYLNKIRLHTINSQKLNNYIDKYNEFLTNNFG